MATPDYIKCGVYNHQSLSLPLLIDPKLSRQLQPHGKPKSTARTQRSLPAQPSTRSLVSASRSPGLPKSSKHKPQPSTDSVVRSPPHQTEQPCSTLRAYPNYCAHERELLSGGTLFIRPSAGIQLEPSGANSVPP